jgi:PKD repeat protein
MHSDRTCLATILRAAGAAGAALIIGGCTLHDQEAPPLSGPSGFGLNLTMVASPAVLPRDGNSQSTITVTARDSSGAAKPNVRVIASVSPEGTRVVQLSESTASDGTVRFVITAPTPSMVAPNNQVVLSIADVGGDFQNATQRSVAVGLLGPSNATYPTANFTFAPTSPKAGSSVLFDASSSTDEGVQCPTCTFDWLIDGEHLTGAVVVKAFTAEGAYPVSLTVTDASGASGSITKAVEVTKAETTTPTTPTTP